MTTLIGKLASSQQSGRLQSARWFASILPVWSIADSVKKMQPLTCLLHLTKRMIFVRLID